MSRIESFLVLSPVCSLLLLLGKELFRTRSGLSNEGPCIGFGGVSPSPLPPELLLLPLPLPAPGPAPAPADPDKDLFAPGCGSFDRFCTGNCRAAVAVPGRETEGEAEAAAKAEGPEAERFIWFDLRVGLELVGKGGGSVESIGEDVGVFCLCLPRPEVVVVVLSLDFLDGVGVFGVAGVIVVKSPVLWVFPRFLTARGTKGADAVV